MWFSFALLLVVWLPNQARATHAMGADLRYECLGGNTYRITLRVYRDCQGSALNETQNIAFASASCGIPRFIQQAPRISLTELSPLCPAQQPNSTCNGGILPGVEEHVYQTTVTLPAQCPDWQISWQLCCRNYAITNSVITPVTRIYIESYLDNLNVACNNSPYFTTAPVPYLCEGEPFNFNNGAIDPDGDSLVFQLVDPLDFISGTPSPIPYMPGFNVNYPMATAPANAFNFDVSSGQFSFTPSGLQQGIVALLVQEYRNGVLIGSTMRDLQMVVINCANQAPVLSPPFNVSGGQLNGNTFSVCAGSTLSFDVSASDPDLIDVVALTSTLASAVPGSNFTVSGSNPVQGSFAWPTTLADIGTYFFTLTAGDNGCPVTAQQVIGYNIIVQTGEVLPPQIIEFCPSSQPTIPLLASTTGPGTFSWSPSAGLSNPAIPNPVASVLDSASYLVTYDGPGTCSIVEPVLLIPEAAVNIDADTARICLGDTVQLSTVFTVTGPPVPFAYTWDPPFGLDNPFGPSPKASPASTGYYVVTVSTLSCSVTDSVLIIVDQPPLLNPFGPAQLCAGDSIAVTASGSNLTDALFNWFPTAGVADPGAGSTFLHPQASAQYTLTASNSCGSASQPLPVTVFPALTLAFSVDSISCAGASDGEVTAAVFGGAGSPQFAWSPVPGIGATLSGLGPGTYSLQVTDAAGCEADGSVQLSDPPALTVSVASQNNLICPNGSEGEVTLTASGGQAPYSYSLDGVNYLNTNIFQNLAAGLYTPSVRDADGCIAPGAPFSILPPPLPLNLQLLNLINTNCNNQVGGIQVAASGGLPPYAYTLDGVNFNSTGQFPGLFPGNYIVSVEDANGCTDTLMAQILLIADPLAQVDSIRHVSCFGGADGFIEISGESGLPPYLFSINGSPYTSDTAFTGLSAGIYQLALQDFNGCRYNLNVQITQPPPVTAVIGNFTLPSCTGLSDGSVLVMGGGGTAPYEFAIGASGYNAYNVFTGLGAGSYTFSVRDVLGCIAFAPFVMADPPQLEGISPGQDPVSCAGRSDGVIRVAAGGGSPAYRFSINGSPFILADSFPNLPAGTYQLEVEDSKGCRDAFQAQITEPAPLGIQVTDLSNVPCFGGASGTVTLAATGGVTPYAFSDDGILYTPATTLDSLRAGAYILRVRDANGCTAEAQAEIQEPDEILGEISVSPVTCPEDSNGRAEVSVAGGTPDYQYLWTNGSTLSSASDLAPGNHVVLVTDANGCQISVSTEVLSPPLIVFDTTWATDVRCFGDQTATLFASARGGQGTLVYSWSNGALDSLVQNVGVGEYTVTVTDSGGCAVQDTLEVEGPPPIVVEIVNEEDAFCDLDNGSVTVLATGGTPGYAYAWLTEPRQEGPQAIGLAPGDYAVLVTDSNRCELLYNVTVEGAPLPVAAFTTDYAPLDSFVIPVIGVQLINLSQHASGYIWDFGDGNTSTETDPLHVFADTGTYRIVLIALDPNGLCPDTAEAPITLLPPGAIYVPNAFTPNDDGYNDEFYPVGIGVEEVRLDIYTRWGYRIATLNSMSERWDGRVNGTASPEGVYVWKIYARINNGLIFKRAGTVTLVR
ncbi:MAG: gliding motility-associated C-terminal domain-containing protein [Bacteroidia bacterium]|nr:gliding motility-associated C-terminal domain-containing protein [Bacteroidia bacterium]